MYKASRGKSKKGFMLIRVHHDNDDYRFWDRYKYPFKIE